jgi:hypothetical protein
MQSRLELSKNCLERDLSQDSGMSLPKGKPNESEGARPAFRVNGVAVVCLVGISLTLMLFGKKLIFPGIVVDFTGFWIGAQLLGTPHIYDVPSNLALQKTIVGIVKEDLIYVQPPFLAAAVRPLTLLPYMQAMVVWKVLILGAFVAFVWLFPTSPRRYTAIAICWSLPASIALVHGNDSPLILLLVALSLLCWKKGREYLAGAMLGLCLIKFHFLTLLPLVLFRREYRRPLRGFIAVAAVLISINFLVQPDWVRLYWQALTLPQRTMNGLPTRMPNFYASFFWTGHPALGVALGALVVISILWPVCRRLPFEVAVPLCIMGGMLISPHTNHLDGILAIPALLTVAYRWPRLRPIAWIALSPAAAWLYCIGPPTWGPTAFVALSLWIMYQVSRESISNNPGCERTSPEDRSRHSLNPIAGTSSLARERIVAAPPA